jgi:RHS repeat-associated protein
LHAITERDASNSGYNWTAIYDGLSRRLSTTTVLVTNGMAFNYPPKNINQYYDPLFEFLELGVSSGNQTIWKLYGPDLDSTYGGLNGTGGLDGVSPYLNLFTPVISDFRGNILAEITNGVVVWTQARPTGFGAVPGFRPVAFANGADLPQSSAWRGRWVDITGYHQIGLRPYDPISGRWLTCDSSWNERDPNYCTFACGDPINYFDGDGRCPNANSLDPSQQYSFEQDPLLAGLYQDYLQERQIDYIAKNVAAFDTYVSGYGDLADVMNAISGGGVTDFENWLSDAVQGQEDALLNTTARNQASDAWNNADWHSGWGITLKFTSAVSWTANTIDAGVNMIPVVGTGKTFLENAVKIGVKDAKKTITEDFAKSELKTAERVYEMPKDWPGQTMEGMANDHAIPKALDPDDPFINSAENQRPMPAAMNSVDKAPLDAELAQRYNQLVDDLVTYEDLTRDQAKAKAWQAMQEEIHAHANSVPARPMNPVQLDQLPSK